MNRSLFYILAVTSLLLLQGFSMHVHAQTLSKHVITFVDKSGSPYTIGNPKAYLSARALQRRRNRGIAIDISDLPVSPRYLDSLRAVPGVNILYTSKWFNQAVIQLTNTTALQRVRAFGFVLSTAAIAARRASPQEIVPVKWNVREATIDYGAGQHQIEIHEGQYLHDKGFTGEGMLVAVLDAGFPGVNTAGPFQHLFESGRIKGTRDFVAGGANVYTASMHGTHVLSTMAARSAAMTGTAPNASYVLIRSEEDGKEQPIEENNWIAGVEYADSIGADVISSSLGYTTFDNPAFNHSYWDLTGDMLEISRAADMAAAKGILVVSSAGNEGNSSWVYITPPADADSVLTVGAVDASGRPATFSGYGPAADGVIKPDVVGMGVAARLIGPNGELTAGSGTSFSTPIVAGLVTCLWQAFPQRTNMEIINVVRASSSRFHNPDDQMGYGIPNFRLAYDSLYRRAQQDTVFIRNVLNEALLKVAPNPFYSQLYIYYHSLSNADLHLRLIDNNGKTIAQRKLAVAAATYGHFLWQESMFSGLPAGIYYLQLVQDNKKSVAKLVKL